MRFAVGHTWDGFAARPDERVMLELTREGGDWILAVDAPFHDDPAPAGSPGATPGLWEYEVVELFLLAPPDHYLEIELGPHGHYWVLELRGVRQVAREALPIEFQVSHRGARWSGRARIPGELVPRAVARLNAFAIHARGDARRYLAFHPVPGDGPDFHRLEQFAELPMRLLKHNLSDLS